MTVYDNIGREVFNTMNISELENTLNNLNSGVYQVKMTTETGSQTIKVVLMK